VAVSKQIEVDDEGEFILFLDFTIWNSGDVEYFEVGTNFIRYVTFTQSLSSELSERFARCFYRVEGPSDENKTHLCIYSYFIIYRLTVINNKPPSRHSSILRCSFVIYLSVNTGITSYNPSVTSRVNALSASLGARSIES
jgi:hypothetical protein